MEKDMVKASPTSRTVRYSMSGRTTGTAARERGREGGREGERDRLNGWHR